MDSFSADVNVYMRRQINFITKVCAKERAFVTSHVNIFVRRK